MKKKIIFTASVPVLWPAGMTVEDLGPVTIKGKVEAIQIMSVYDKK